MAPSAKFIDWSVLQIGRVILSTVYVAGVRQRTGFEAEASGLISERAELHSRRKPAGATRLYSGRPRSGASAFPRRDRPSSRRMSFNCYIHSNASDMWDMIEKELRQQRADFEPAKAI
jgi:hypothetical protein